MDPEEHRAEADHDAAPVVADAGVLHHPAEAPPALGTVPDLAQDVSAKSDALAAADGQGSAHDPQKPALVDNPPQPAAGRGADVKLDSSMPNGLHAAVMDSPPTTDDQPQDIGLFAGLDVEARSVDKSVGEDGNGVQSDPATEQANHQAQESGF